jgi:hypothetical protein
MDKDSPDTFLVEIDFIAWGRNATIVQAPLIQPIISPIIGFMILFLSLFATAL